MPRKLTDSEESTVCNALRVAAERYREDALLFATDVPVNEPANSRLVAKFQSQAAEADRLLELIEAGDVVVEGPSRR